MSIWGSAVSALSGRLDDAARAALTIGRAFGGGRTIVLVETADDQFQVRGERDTSAPVGELRFADGRFIDEGVSRLGTRLAGADVEIVLAARRFLFRKLDLPEKAQGFLDAVIRAQIDRLTPWSEAQTAFGHAVPTAISDGRIEVTVAAARRSKIAPFADALNAFKPEAIVVSTEADARRARIAVLRREANRERRLRRVRARLLGGLAAAGSLATVCLGLWIFVGGALAAADEDVARQIAERRASLAGPHGESATAALARKKRQAVASVIVLEQLSRALPDDTYLTRMKIENGKVEIAGVTREAASLIGILEQTKAFQRATFSAPTTQTPGADGEQFQIEAEIIPTLAVTR